MSPGCTYRSGECDEKASWQRRVSGKTPLRTRRTTPRPPRRRPSERARVNTPHRPAAHHRCTTITGTPMLVDQRRSRSDLHRVTVLGSFSVTAHGDPVPLESDARRVVAYLAVHRRPQRCPALAADLWPGLPAATAAALLDQSLVAAAPLLTDATDGTVALDPAVTVDLDEAMALVRELAIVPGHPDSVPADLPVAIVLLGADVLPEWTEAWLPVERERFRQIRLNALEELSSALTASGRFADAVVTARAAVHTAPSREGARPCADRGAPRPGRHRRGRRGVRRVPGAAAQQRRRGPHVRVRRGVRPRRPVPARARLAGPARPPPHGAGTRGGPRAARGTWQPSARVRRIGARRHPLTPAPSDRHTPNIGSAPCRRYRCSGRGVQRGTSEPASSPTHRPERSRLVTTPTGELQPRGVAQVADRPFG